MTHLIVSRVNLHMDLDPYKYSDTQVWARKGYNDSRLKLLNTFARSSLKKQSNQNFVFITLWQEGHLEKKDALENEIQIMIKRTNTEDDEPLNYDALMNSKQGKLELNYSQQITDKIKKHFSGPILITNLDCDDALHVEYVDIVQAEIEKTDFDRSEPYFFNVERRYFINTETTATGYKQTKSPAPMVTTYEPELSLFPVKYNHYFLERWVPKGKNVQGLYALQSVNETNMFTTGTGKRCKININEFINHEDF